MVSSKALVHDKDVITDGYQKCKGAAPSLISRAIINSEPHRVPIEDVDQSDMLANNIIAEPMA